MLLRQCCYMRLGFTIIIEAKAICNMYDIDDVWYIHWVLTSTININIIPRSLKRHPPTCDKGWDTELLIRVNRSYSSCISSCLLIEFIVYKTHTKHGVRYLHNMTILSNRDKFGFLSITSAWVYVGLSGRIKYCQLNSWCMQSSNFIKSLSESQ